MALFDEFSLDDIVHLGLGGRVHKRRQLIQKNNGLGAAARHELFAVRVGARSVLLGHCAREGKELLLAGGERRKTGELLVENVGGLVVGAGKDGPEIGGLEGTSQVFVIDCSGGVQIESSEESLNMMPSCGTAMKQRLRTIDRGMFRMFHQSTEIVPVLSINLSRDMNMVLLPLSHSVIPQNHQKWKVVILPASATTDNEL